MKKYDINQKVLEALADAQSRTILFSIVKKGKTAMELSEKYRIPLSSVYKKISDLEKYPFKPCVRIAMMKFFIILISYVMSIKPMHLSYLLCLSVLTADSD